jgi:shikimate dehydrogenase
MTADAYCVVGHPVAHSRSPWIHARFARDSGEAMQYDRLLAPLDGFAETLRGFRASGGRGCNVTLPFKFAARTCATSLSRRARLAGACNTLRFDGSDAVFGDNTDGAGLVGDIQQGAGVDLAGRDILLVGAGGAAAGALGPLLEAAPRRVVLANRTVEKALALRETHAAPARACGVVLDVCTLDAVPAGFHVVINSTAASLSGAGVPVAGSVLAPGALAYDMMYGPAAEGFLQWARRHGAHGRDGLGMLVEQAAESFLVWRGVRPATAGVLADLRALLASG